MNKSPLDCASGGIFAAHCSRRLSAYCHALPVRDARLPFDSGKTQSHCVALGLLPSLQSIRSGEAIVDALEKR